MKMYLPQHVVRSTLSRRFAEFFSIIIVDFRFKRHCNMEGQLLIASLHRADDTDPML